MIVAEKPKIFTSRQVTTELVKARYTGPDHVSKGFSLSNVMKACPRQIIYNLLGFKPVRAKVPEAWILASSRGNDIHDLYQNNWRKAKLPMRVKAFKDHFNDDGELIVTWQWRRKKGEMDYAVELPFSEHNLTPWSYELVKKYGISPNCRPDCICIGHGKELKTVDDAKFDQSVRYLLGEEVEEKTLKRHEGYEWQMQGYMWILDLPEWRLIVVNREGDIYKPIERVYRRDDAMIEQLKTELLQWKAYLDGKILPEPDKERGGCQWLGCDYKHLCPAWAK